MFSSHSEPDFYTLQAKSFDSICAAAEKNDGDALEKLLSTGIYINMQRGLHTPVSYLAEKGDEKAVKCLLDHGGNIQEAVRGFAMGSEHTIVQSYIDRDFAFISDALEGYAFIGDDDKVRDLLRYGHSQDSAVHGYAKGNQSVQLEQELKRRGIGAIRDTVSGAAMAGDKDSIIEPLIEQYWERNLAIHGAILFAAFGGHDQLVKQLMEKYQAEDTYPDSAALGYIRLGHGEQLGKMILQGARAERCAHYYSMHAQFPRHKHAIVCALRLLTSIPQDSARKQMAVAMQKYVCDKIDFQLETVANEIRSLMKEKRIDFAHGWEKYKESMSYIRRCMFN
jgi:hypothetical protein